MLRASLRISSQAEMYTWTLFALLGAAAAQSSSTSSAAASRPSGTSICNYYTEALLKSNTAENQYKLLTLLVNTAVIGNYTQPNVGVTVPGILAPGMLNGTAVDLLGYFNGSLASSNRGGSSGVSVNFLDGGGAAPLKENKPADNDSSNQYKLLTHLYEYFGAALGCSQYGNAGFPAYAGVTGMYKVHKYMALDQYEVGYFIEQVGLSAASFGVSKADVTAVGMMLGALFDYRCTPPTAVLPSASSELQAICIASSCPLATASPTCSAYAAVVEPKAAGSSNSTMGGSGSSNSTMGGGSSNGTSGGSGTSSSSGSTPSGSSGSATGQSNSASGLGVSVFGSAVVLGAGVLGMALLL